MQHCGLEFFFCKINYENLCQIHGMDNLLQIISTSYYYRGIMYF